MPQPEYQNGFEIYLPVVDLKKFDGGGSFGRIKGVIIASDFDYSGDFRDDLVFGVNHLPSKRALTYHDEGAQEFAKNPKGRKIMESLPIYRWSDEPERFPFESLNPLKSADCSYTLINVSPAEVYRALEKIGFRL